MALPNGTKVQMIDVYCPGCARLSFKATEGTRLVGALEVKCHRCNTITLYHDGFVFTMQAKEKVHLPKEY